MEQRKQLSSKPWVAIKRVLKENFLTQKLLYAIAICAMIIVAATTSATAWIMKLIFDVLSQDQPSISAIVVAVIVLVLFILKGFATYLQQVTLSKAGNRVVANLQRRIYQKLLKQELSWFDSTETPDLLVKVTQSAQSARQIIDIVVTSFVRDLLTLVGLIAVMLWQHVFLSLIFLVIGPIALLGLRNVLVRVREIMSAELASMTEILKVLQETSVGIRVVRAFGLEVLLEERMDHAVKDVERRSNSIIRLESMTHPLMDGLAGLAIATIIVVSNASVGADKAPNAGELMAFITALLMAYEPAKRLSRMRVSLEASFVGVRMLFAILDRSDALAESIDAVDLPLRAARVTFRNVAFCYRAKKRVLNNVSLNFGEGRTTALVGPSGGGKSTIISLLLRLYDPDKGSIEIGGVDLRKVTRNSLQRYTAYVGQNTFLFSTTVRENIRMGRLQATDAEVEQAAREAHADEFITSLPKGYDTPVGENGVYLSGGQRQRLSIARAILKNAPILLLDEATSALDNESERLVSAALSNAKKGRTTILIAHRFSTLKSADRIFFIDGGRVIEKGSLSELIKENGRFCSMFSGELHLQTFESSTEK